MEATYKSKLMNLGNKIQKAIRAMAETPKGSEAYKLAERAKLEARNEANGVVEVLNRLNPNWAE